MSPGCFVGLMSGTSLDGVDAVLVRYSEDTPVVLASAHRAFAPAMRQELLRLNDSGSDELARAARIGMQLARLYAEAVEDSLAKARVSRAEIEAIGCHGQTVRHRPVEGYSIQLGNAALLAELTSLRVVCDFRSRDLAAGGQGAPLVPAFHAAVFARRGENRAVLNVGGIANVTLLAADGSLTGFDIGPGNCLMDVWALRHCGEPYDRDGAWAASGTVLPRLLQDLTAEPYFKIPPPKSTGRDLFNDRWLDARVPPNVPPADVQATLLELTARSVSDAIQVFGAQRVIVCGGGARNGALMARLRERLSPADVAPSSQFGIDPQHVEAIAFAWLAKQTLEGKAANVPSVTGARGPRVLGAIYPP